MGYKEFEFSLPTDYTEEQLRKKISKTAGTQEFTFSILKKSLDARKKKNILWRIRILLRSDSFKGDAPAVPILDIPYKKRGERVLVTGSGPAGFFAAYVLQKSGFNVTLIERGLDVDRRSDGINCFEAGGVFQANANYAFGEGGAGTFSDGKLTSRTKSIKKESNFIFNSYIKAGAPPEIAYLTHPHLGTDNLKVIVRNLRYDFKSLGGEILFDCLLTDIRTASGAVTSAESSAGQMEFDYLFIAPGHSSFETYRMLMRRGVRFCNKNFAVGSRVEHPQRIINLAQWGHETLPGVKAAEYRLTSQADDLHPVYTFCMCPGGTVVPATAYEGNNIVNGMSLYRRGGEYANAACVAGVNIEQLNGRETSPLEALDWLEALERCFFDIAPDYKAPAVSIKSFLEQKIASPLSSSSFPLGLTEYPIWEALPSSVARAMQLGLKDFSRKIRGWDEGLIMGLESKTSAPVQVLRDKTGLAEGFENLFIIGEGSGWSGGIISSAADGIRAAMRLITEK
jgi:hypothetical protein